MSMVDAFQTVGYNPEFLSANSVEPTPPSHQPPGVATPLHRHQGEAEVFYLLEGAMDYEAGGELYRLEQGSVMWLPMGVPHRFRI